MANSKNAMKKQVWLKYTEEEVKEIILKIAEKDPSLTAEKIGLILRDNYGIPQTKIYGFKISQVLKQKKIYTNPDLKNLKSKVSTLLKHIYKNKQDKKTGRSFIITKAKLKIAEDYHARKQK